jgi:hypothetical protein
MKVASVRKEFLEEGWEIGAEDVSSDKTYWVSFEKRPFTPAVEGVSIVSLADGRFVRVSSNDLDIEEID